MQPEECHVGRVRNDVRDGQIGYSPHLPALTILYRSQQGRVELARSWSLTNRRGILSSGDETDAGRKEKFSTKRCHEPFSALFPLAGSLRSGDAAAVAAAALSDSGLGIAAAVPVSFLPFAAPEAAAALEGVAGGVWPNVCADSHPFGGAMRTSADRASGVS